MATKSQKDEATKVVEENNENKKDTTTKLTEPLEIDDQCDVLWRDGKQTLRCKIIERRPLNFRKRKKSNNSKDTAAATSVENLKADEIEYYVHYINQDRYECVDEYIESNESRFF